MLIGNVEYREIDQKFALDCAIQYDALDERLHTPSNALLRCRSNWMHAVC